MSDVRREDTPRRVARVNSRGSINTEDNLRVPTRSQDALEGLKDYTL